MKLDLNQVIAHVGARHSVEINEPPIRDSEPDDGGQGLHCLQPIVGRVTVTNAGDGIVVRGHASTEVELVSGRSLERFALPVRVEIDESYPLEMKAAPGRREEVLVAVDEDYPPIIDDKNVLDLTELLRQTILLQLPISPRAPGEEEAEPLSAASAGAEAAEAEELDERHHPFARLKELYDGEGAGDGPEGKPAPPTRPEEE